MHRLAVQVEADIANIVLMTKIEVGRFEDSHLPGPIKTCWQPMPMILQRDLMLRPDVVELMVAVCSYVCAGILIAIPVVCYIVCSHQPCLPRPLLRFYGA